MAAADKVGPFYYIVSYHDPAIEHKLINMGFVKVASVFDIIRSRGITQFTSVFRSWFFLKNNSPLIRIAPMHSLNNDQYSGCWFDKEHLTYFCLICQKHYYGKPYFHLNHHNSKM